MSNMPVGVLRDIASELKMIRKVLERMAQAPMFDIPQQFSNKIYYDHHPEDDSLQE